MTAMEAAQNTYLAFKAREAARDAGVPANEWAEKNPELAEYCGQVDHLRGLL